MKWNWQKKDWPDFKYDTSLLEKYEDEFLHKSGIFLGTLKHIQSEEKIDLKIDIICEEAYRTSLIEGELLNRESIQSSIKRNFGISVIDIKKIPNAEAGLAEMMLDLYDNFSHPISKKSLGKWNSLILDGINSKIKTRSFRKDTEPMQVISGSVYRPKIHFEAPPSETLEDEMKNFIQWFNNSKPNSQHPLKTLTRAGLAHLYFVCIHPFDDGNGRIARALAEKALSQGLGEASLISLSQVIEKHRKQYYAMLDASNRDLEVTDWLEYFSKTALEALELSQKSIEFSLKKGEFYRLYENKLNLRQEKVISRIFKEGIQGFKGGLSAENYISITKTSRATATRDLQELVEMGVLVKTGNLKGTRYYLELE
jgi:Fic family protein